MNVDENTLPRTIRDLISEARSIGGEVEMPADRLFEFVLPVRVVGGEIRMVRRATVGYFPRDGKNVIRGAADVRSEIAYWGRQSGRA